MIDRHIVRLRLHSQLLADHAFVRPSDVVAWLGAVQAQDYQGALWALGLRAVGSSVADVEQEIAERRIVRTWPMRGTLHFVPAADVRWMLDLLAPRAITRSAGRLRDLGLDEDALALSRRICVGELQGGRQLTRGELYGALARGGVSPAGQRGIHVISRLSQEGLLCFGTRQGRQPTFRLLHEWLPDARPLSRDESLARLSTCYFTGHGPATIRDFAWWAGLSVDDARRSVEVAGQQLVRAAIDGQTYWLAPEGAEMLESQSGSASTVHLLPPYDEYTVAYRDRSAVVDPAYAGSVADLLIRPAVVIDGVVCGSWRRSHNGRRLVVAAGLAGDLEASPSLAIAGAAEAYGRFRGLPVTTDQGVPPGRHAAGLDLAPRDKDLDV